MRTVHFVVPRLASPSGGNVYNRRLAEGLESKGWSVVWTHTVEAGAVNLVDGLVLPEVGDTSRVVALMHMPLLTESERDLLTNAQAVIVTSEWSARSLAGLNVHVARPGVDPAPITPASEKGERLLCVAAVTPTKGHDVLIEALARTPGSWTCVCVGPLDRDAEFASRLSTLDGRVKFTGAIEGNSFYDNADLVVLPSRHETYGMVVTEALARGIPVLASEVGGIPEALGTAADATLPGVLVPPGDPDALAAALHRWLNDAAWRDHLRRAALSRRTTLTGWAETVTVVSKVLTEVDAGTRVGR